MTISKPALDSHPDPAALPKKSQPECASAVGITLASSKQDHEPEWAFPETWIFGEVHCLVA